ncbi:MarR family transcriptional regulator [Formosa sp. A9]|uniref:MarR family transcriptional regulator n=1 Tax=Formosa sp. A9 TaxID=3442641 RepID=UPI003EBF1036
MEDFLTTLQVEGFTSRLKRLSDVLLYATRDLYKTEGVDIEPNWNLVFRLLQEHDALTITEMSERLQLSHPAVVKIVKKMKKSGYVEAVSDREDKRKQILKLTPKAQRQIKTIEVLWEAQNQVLEQLLAESPHLLEELGHIEKRLNEQDYKQRVRDKLNA